jgi:hypothetical protein
MPRTRATTVHAYGYEVSGVVTFGIAARFDRSWDAWLPEEGPEVDDLCVRDEAGIDVTGALSDDELDKCSDALCEAAVDDEMDARADAMESRADAERERRMLGD